MGKIKTKKELSKPSDGALQAIATASVAMAPKESAILSWHKQYASSHITRLAFDLDMIELFASANSRILEVGSAPFILSKAIMDRGFKIQGTDIDPSRYQSAIHESGLPIVKCDVESSPLPFPSNSHDVVIFNELFEHLRINPIFTMSEVYRVLKTGGVLMLSTPNLKSLVGIARFLLKSKAYSCSAELFKEYSKLENLGHMGHVREYTVVEVVEFLRKLNFDPIEVIYRGSFGSRITNAVTTLMPRLRPFFSVIAVK